jgi:hypothetical protein
MQSISDIGVYLMGGKLNSPTDTTGTWLSYIQSGGGCDGGISYMMINDFPVSIP